jgi:hypothetical protein
LILPTLTIKKAILDGDRRPDHPRVGSDVSSSADEEAIMSAIDDARKGDETLVKKH